MVNRCVERTRGRGRCRRQGSWLLPAAIGLCLLAGGCAKTPTIILIDLSADGTTPPLLLLRTIVVSDADATKRSTGNFVSLAGGDAADRPGPFPLPMKLSLSVPPSFVGAVTVTVEGLDWDSGKVIARGTGAGTVVNEQQTQAAVTLMGVVPVGSGDGGNGDAADPDASPPPDGDVADGGLTVVDSGAAI